MTGNHRKNRGYRSQKVVADWFKGSGWPYAESAGAGRQGVDVLGVPGVSPEVKARRGLNLTGWLKQATDNRGNGLACLIVRPDGYGEAKIAQWPVVLTLADFTELLHAAGYGDPNVKAIDN